MQVFLIWFDQQVINSQPIYKMPQFFIIFSSSLNIEYIYKYSLIMRMLPIDSNTMNTFSSNDMIKQLCDYRTLCLCIYFPFLPFFFLFIDFTKFWNRQWQSFAFFYCWWNRWLCDRCWIPSFYREWTIVGNL